MPKTQVTNTALPPAVRYISRSGVLQIDPAEINRLVEERMPQHYRDEQKLGRTTRNELENELRAITDRETDGESCVASLTPQVWAGENKAAQLREDVENLTQAVAERVPGSRETLKHTQTKLRYAEDQLAAFKLRLSNSTRGLAAIKALKREWHKLNDANLARLVKLTPDTRGR